MHLLESAYGNWLIKVFRVLVCSTFFKANGALLQGLH